MSCAHLRTDRVIERFLPGINPVLCYYRDPMGRPRNDHGKLTIEVAVTPKLVNYLDLLKKGEGFGNSRAEIVRNFVWKEVNRLIETGRLKSG